MNKVLLTLSLVFALALLTACGGTDSEPSSATTDPAATAKGAAENPASSTPEEAPVDSASTLSMSQQQAVKKAEEYLAYTSFSRKGLIDQLVFEGFNEADATFAVDTVAPDWNAQAALKAQEYIDYSSFSRQGLIDQLVFEGFSAAEAEYGVTAIGY